MIKVQLLRLFKEFIKKYGVKTRKAIDEKFFLARVKDRSNVTKKISLPLQLQKLQRKHEKRNISNGNKQEEKKEGNDIRRSKIVPERMQAHQSLQFLTAQILITQNSARMETKFLLDEIVFL